MPNNFSKSSVLNRLRVLVVSILAVCMIAAVSVDQFFDHISQTAQRGIKLFATPGMAVALIENGEVARIEGYGVKDKVSKESVRHDTLFQCASISKSVTAVGIMKLAEDGHISLNDPVSRHLTRWSLPRSEFNQEDVTIARVLSHTAGLSVHGYPGMKPGRPLPTLEQSLSRGHPMVGAVHIKQRPGKGFSYSGGGYTILQLMVEEVTGRDFAKYMKEEVLDPLGMVNSTFDQDAGNCAATPHGFFAQKIPTRKFTELAAAGFYTTAEDLLIFTAALMTGPNREPPGRGVVSPATVELMTTSREESNNIYGLGFFIRQVNGRKVVLHGGANRGLHSSFAIEPGSGRAIVILTNSNRGAFLKEKIFNDWLEQL